MTTRFVKLGVLGIGLASTMALASPAAAQSQCSRETLQGVADDYVKAQQQGSIFALPVGEWVDYRENFGLTSTATGVISQPADFAWNVELVDSGNCRVLVEGVILKPKPYVIATRLAWSFNGLGQIGSVVTQPGDPDFDAQRAFDTASKEDWGTIPADKQDTRDALMAAAKAWLAEPGRALDDPEFTVDETKGAVGVRGQLGAADGPAVSHVFRIEGGKIVYVHTLMAKQGS